MSRLLNSIGLGQNSASVLIGLGEAGAAWQSATREWLFEPAASAHNSSSEIASLIQNVQQRTTGLNPAHIKWLVSPDLMPTWVQTPAAGIRSLEELQALAQARANQLFGIPVASPWLLSANWHHVQSFLCTAVDAAWTRDLPRKITSIFHLLLKEAEQQLEATTWLAITTNTHLHLLHRKNKRWSHLRSLRLPAAMSGDNLLAKLNDEWQRESLKIEQPADQLQWLNTGLPSSAILPSNIKKLQPKALAIQQTQALSLSNLKAPNIELQALAQDVHLARYLLQGGVS